METVDLLTLKDLAGWKTLSTVQRDAHLSPGHQRQAIERLVTRVVSASRPTGPPEPSSARRSSRSDSAVTPLEACEDVRLAALEKR